MTLAELKEQPSILEHWKFVRGSVDEFLVAHLVETCLGAEGKENAQAEVGASKAIANLIKTFRSIGGRPAERKKPRTKQLHRFSAEEKKPGETQQQQ